jgi:hypothetical protein
MDNRINTGFNDLKQVELAIDAAQKVVGSATMSMDKGMLQDATNAVQDARNQLANVRSNPTGVDNDFLQKSEQVLSQCEEQLNEAKN